MSYKSLTSSMVGSEQGTTMLDVSELTELSDEYMLDVAEFVGTGGSTTSIEEASANTVDGGGRSSISGLVQLAGGKMWWLAGLDLDEF